MASVVDLCGEQRVDDQIQIKYVIEFDVHGVSP